MEEYIQRERRVQSYFMKIIVIGLPVFISNPEIITRLNVKASEWPYPKDQRQSHGMKPVEDPNGKIEVNGKISYGAFCCRR